MIKNIKKVVATPLSDSDIREYLPNANIIKDTLNITACSRKILVGSPGAICH